MMEPAQPLWQPALLQACPHREQVPPYVRSKPLLFQYMPIVSLHPATHPCEEPVSSISVTSL